MTASTTPTRRRPAKVTASAGDALAEAIELTRRLRLPHVRRQLTDLIPTARAQRWDPADLVRVLLAEEATGRDAAMLATRRKNAGWATPWMFRAWAGRAQGLTAVTRYA